MRKITKLLSDDNQLETIKNNNEWLKEEIKTNVDILKKDNSKNDTSRFEKFLKFVINNFFLLKLIFYKYLFIFTFYF